jgi:hypothetical protein
MLSLNQKIILIFLTVLIYISYFLGFFFNENSIGSGGYNGDLTWIWKNFDIFKNNNLIEAINHKEFYGNRTPLLYLINIFFNPFVDNIDNYRMSIFIISLLSPIILYLCLKEKYKEIDKEILFLISSILLLSPYYRTSSIWGMEIFYGIVTMLISIYFINKIDSSKKAKLLDVLMLTFFSSLTLYFDQKLLFIPILALIRIFVITDNIKIKISTILFYSIFAIPFIYLMIQWNGIVPVQTQLSNPNTITNLSRLDKIYFYNLGYTSTLLGFYLLPMLFLKEYRVKKIINNFFSSKKFYLLIFTPLIYIFILYNYYSFQSYTVDEYWIGFGFAHKIALFLFSNLIYQELFTYFAFFFSWIVICLYVKKSFTDYLIILFFFILALLIWPLMQEYFDPIILILALTLFKTKINLNFNNTLFLFCYYLIFLISANIYYLKIL